MRGDSSPKWSNSWWSSIWEASLSKWTKAPSFWKPKTKSKFIIEAPETDTEKSKKLNDLSSDDE